MSWTKQILIAVSFTVVAASSTLADWKENARAIDISGGEDHTLVLTQNKWPWACGDNYWYQLGIGNDQDQKTLVRVQDGNMVTISGYLEDINDIDAGWKHSLALESYDPWDPNCSGYVWAWGRNDKGELGDNQGKYPFSDVPVQVLRGEQAPADPNNPDPNLARIIEISAGRSGEHSLAVDVNGYAYAWGYNEYGQCGNGRSAHFVKDFA
jgi:alpha-tubulin suppressor-like RCC1 family protein